MSEVKRDLTPLFRPRSLALIGASDDPTRIRGKILAQIVKGNYPGRIFPIHPTARTIQGMPAFAAIGEAPGPIDLALIAIPAESVPATLAQCAAAGVRSALVFSSGFAEEEGGAHRALQDELRAIARDTGMAVAGPNSVGMLDLAEPLAATFSPAIDFAALPGLRADPARRRIGIISQSGGLGFALFNRGLKRNLAFSTVINTGNEADLDACDILDFMLDDERTGIVLMFVEAIRRGRRFVELAERALALDKPIIVAKIGRSPAGRRAAASHTASLTGSDTVHDAIFRRYGVIRANDQDDMLDIAAACALCPRPHGKRVGVVTISGGVGGWLADTLESHGLTVPEFSAALQREIRQFLPSYGAAFNPIDITAQAIGNDHRLRSIAALEAAAEIDAIAVVSTLAADPRMVYEKAALAELVARQRKPILFYSYPLPSEQARRDLAEIGVPCYTSLRGPALALAALADREAASCDRARLTTSPGDPVSRDVALRRLDAAAEMLCEYEANDVLAAYGIATLPARLAKDAAAAVDAATSLGYPVALKIQSPDIPHKSDAGGVALGLADAAAVRDAWAAMLARIAERLPAARLHGVLVQTMAPRGLEMIAGTVDDVDFGPLLTVGLGGIHVEMLGDVATLPLPIDALDAQSLLERLRGVRLLGPLRGAPARDRAAFAALLVRLARLQGDFAGHIATIDLNPVLLHDAGDGISVVDALIVQRRPAQRGAA
ncbi:MAG TPA: acetate--CoA ligase family protein [Stellaceae bacterium]|nr:acetate--CoA ligase family protein [Stellaceae bacterium]